MTNKYWPPWETDKLWWWLLSAAITGVAIFFFAVAIVQTVGEAVW